MDDPQPSALPSTSPGEERARGAGSGASARVVKNSMWLIAQPLVLNAISIFATAYIARTLGPKDYGRFVFALAFIAVFQPLTNLGLRFIATRDLATTARNAPSDYISGIATLRLVLALASAGVCVAVTALGPPGPETAQVVYIAAAIIVLQAITSTANDVFQAFENMRLVAEVQFTSGLILTVGSVVALYLGLGLPGLMASYVIGQLVGTSLSQYYLFTRYASLRPRVDLAFWKSSLVRAAPLFLPSLVLQAGTRLGVVVLGAVAGQTAVGSYGAADTLVEKLLIIPDGVCTALFPTLASVFSRSREEAGALYRKIFRYFLLLALPIAVGTTVLAHPIIDLMYGAEYRRSAWVLVVLAWGLFVSFFAQLHGWSVGAIGQERRGFMVPIYATGVYLAVGGLLIPELGELGLAIAGVVLSAVSFALNGRILRAHLSDRAIPGGEAARVILASAVMGAVTFAVRAAPVYVSIPVGVAAYGLAAVGTKAVRPSELSELLGMVRGRFRARPAAES